MKKKKDDELLEECNCADNCNCGCGNDCHCDEHCDCECCCGEEIPPIEEKLVLVGLKDDKKTEKAIKILDKKEIDYYFMDLNETKEDEFPNIDKKIEIPSLLLIQTIVADAAFGLDEIKEAIEE